MGEQTAAARCCGVVMSLLVLAACTSVGGSVPAVTGLTPNPPTPDLQAKAAAQATTIVAQAQATAVVMRAQVAATALIQSARETTPAPTGKVESTAPGNPSSERSPGKTPVPQAGAAESVSQTTFDGDTGQATSAPLPAGGVELRGVGMAADDAMIIVRFRSTPKVTERWYQGMVSVQDEQTGMLYNEIPVMPIIGPLFQRPRKDGGAGYVMLVNPPPGVKPGSVVTVVLGNFRQEHVVVQP